LQQKRVLRINPRFSKSLSSAAGGRPAERIAPADSPALALLRSLMIDRTLTHDVFLKQFHTLMGRPMPPCALLAARLSSAPLPNLTSVSFCNILKERLAAYGVSWFLSGDRTLCALSEAPFPRKTDQTLADLAGYARDSLDLDVRFALSDGLIAARRGRQRRAVQRAQAHPSAVRG
jgi:hypothetical protein